MTNATCGLRGFLSSPSAALQQSLENRLRRRLDGAGSTLFSLTWKAKATPAGRPYCQLAASARRTSDSGFGSWPLKAWTTPTAGNACGANMARKGGTSLNTDATLAAWPTPKVSTGDYQYDRDGSKILNLSGAAKLAVWPTPQSRDGQHGRSGQPERTGGQRRNLDDYATLAGWATPAAHEAGGTAEQFLARKEKARANGAELGVSLTSLSLQATLAHWATPTASEKFRSENFAKGRQPNMTELARLAASGPTPNGSPAPTEKPGQLDPDHSRWVMGYSAAHLSCAPTEMPSSRKSRPK